MSYEGGMRPLPVLHKIGPIFEYIRDAQGRPTGQTHDRCIIHPSPDSFVTAKMDGTCCLIRDGAIFARQDVKNLANAPLGWFPSDGTELDKNGYMIGFRPLDAKKGDKWHIMALYGEGEARFLEYDAHTKTFRYVIRPIRDFNGLTCELLGPSVNGNKHKLEKHAYIIHGSVLVDAPWESHKVLQEWLDGPGKIYEGIVIHDVGNNAMYKCHRGHLGGSMIWEGCPLPMMADVGGV